MKPQPLNPDAEDLSRLYEASFAGMTTYKVGQAVTCRVLSISKDSVFLELNSKNEGILPKEDVTGKDGQLTVAVGDSLKAFYLGQENGEMRFTTRIQSENAGLELLEQAFREGIPVDGVVEREIKGGYEVKLGSHRAFCPYSQMGPKRSETPGEYIGRRLSFRIQEFKENGRNMTVSNRVFHEEARQEALEALKATLQVGQVVKGTVLSLQSFGAFVNVQGIQALLPLSELSRQRVEDVASVLQVGQEIEATILKIDWATQKISLSRKALEADPWERAIERYPEGSKHQGRVSRVAAFGAFVTLEPGLDGLVHVSEFRNDSKYVGGADVPVKPGHTLSVQVLSVDRTQRRLALKPATTKEEDETASRYLGSDEGTGYNPFAALLKKK